MLAFRRSIPGNSVVVLANFGIAPATLSQGTAPEQTVAGVAPKEAAPAITFRNLEAPAATVTLPLKGRYTDWFTGAVFRGETTLTLAPGEYIVLTK